MQVATLFRESSTLLGATMETAGVGSAGTPGTPGTPGGCSSSGTAVAADHPNGAGSDTPDSASSSTGLEPAPVPYESHYNHPLANKYKLAICKQEFESGPWPYESHYTHPLANKYKLNMKLEPHDDGYETSADLLLSTGATPGREPKCEKLEDPYSFIDDDPMPMLPMPQGPPSFLQSPPPLGQLVLGPKKRGRKKKIKTDELDANLGMNGGLPRPIKERKKHDRFNGMPEEEVSKRTLPDHLAANLDIVIIGINPGLFAAYKGHHYAGPGNHFWKCLYLSGLTKEQMTADEDYKLLQSGVGFTNMVQRPTKGSADLTRKEIKEGSQILLEKLRKFRPKIAVFNGKLIYEVFSGKKDFHFGRQPDRVDGTNTYIWVMPSSSARCAQLPRAADKVPFYAALKKFRDYLNGLVASIDESEMVFTEPRLKACYEPEPKPDPDLMDISNAVIKTEDGAVVPGKKKRGRPKKIKVEGEEPPKPAPRKTTTTTSSSSSSTHGNCDFPKKKRGRPKKVKVEEAESPAINMDTSTSMNKCFSSPSPIQSPVNYYHLPPDVTPPNGTGSLYAPQAPIAYNQSPRPHSYSQSPRPHSQSFTHSDLSSEISAAISSEQLGSPASPSLGPPDFEPPSSMAEDGDCRFSSPASSTPSDPAHYPYQSSYSIDVPMENHYQPPPPRQPQDIASKSLSGLESLVDQIPSIAESDSPLTDTSEHYTGGQYNSMNNFNMQPAPARSSPVPYSYPPTSGYPLYPTPTWTSHYEPMPLAYPQIPYPQSYGPGLHVPSHNYPYYSYPQPAPAHPPGYPPYLGGF